MSAEELLGQYARRLLGPVGTLEAVTARTAARNPRVTAFAIMDPAALAAAGESGARWRAGRPLGLPDGVPCTVKDVIGVAGLPNAGTGAAVRDAGAVGPPHFETAWPYDLRHTRVGTPGASVQ